MGIICTWICSWHEQMWHYPARHDCVHRKMIEWPTKTTANCVRPNRQIQGTEQPHDLSANAVHKLMSFFSVSPVVIVIHHCAVLIQCRIFAFRMKYLPYLFRYNVSVAICGAHIKKLDVQIHLQSWEEEKTILCVLWSEWWKNWALIRAMDDTHIHSTLLVCSTAVGIVL